MPIATDPIDPSWGDRYPGNPGGDDLLPPGSGDCGIGMQLDPATGLCVPVTGTTMPPPPTDETQPPPTEQTEQCGPGTYWDDFYRMCIQTDEEYGQPSDPPVEPDLDPKHPQSKVCWDVNSPYYDKPDCVAIRGEVVGDPGYECPPGYVRQGGKDGPCVYDGGTGGGNTGGGDTGGGTQPPVGGGEDPYNTVLPPVDPYDVSQSPDWMTAPTEIGGVSATDPQAGQFGYDEVSDFSDAAWQNARRYIDPQMQLQDERFAQELINQGVDPYSEAGQKAFRQKEMAQSDLLSKSAFDALGYGANLQNQMFGQDATRSQLANALLQSQWGLTQRGHEFDIGAGMQSNQQAFDQMMGLEGLNYRDYLSMVDQGRYQDSLALALAGLAPGPSYGTVNTGMPEAPLAEYNAGQDLWANLWS